MNFNFHEMTLDQLFSLNKLVIREIKARRTNESAALSSEFNVGDYVQFTNRRTGQTLRGYISKVKRLKAIIRLDNNTNWDVPFNMLSKVS